MNNHKLTDEIILFEINYALNKIKEVPNNESPYSYIRGLINPIKQITNFAIIKETMQEIINLYPDCYHAVSLLLDYYENENDQEEEKNKEKCYELIDVLVNVDYIRKKYWLWRKNKIERLKNE